MSEEELGSLLYPEHEKLQKRIDDVRVLGEFFEWMKKNDLVLAVPNYTRGKIPDSYEEHQDPDTHVIQRFIGVDPEKLEQERLAMQEHERYRGEEG